MPGQVARRRLAHIEMLVEPAIRRNKDAGLMPRNDDLLFTLGPHDRVALTHGNDDDEAGSVAVALLIGTRVEDRHVAGHLRLGKLDVHHASARAAAPEWNQ